MDFFDTRQLSWGVCWQPVSAIDNVGSALCIPVNLIALQLGFLAEEMRKRAALN